MDEFDRILRPIQDQMIQTVWRVLGNIDDADDALQEALMRIWRVWPRVMQHENPQALALKICSDCAYDELRRQCRRSRSKQLAGQEASSLPEPSEQLSRTEMRISILDAIARLPKNQAVAFVMRTIQQQSYQEIATALGCAESTARKHVNRARSRLSGLLTKVTP
jgi:RNA polymerase sigma factor (sigma-70 family)